MDRPGEKTKADTQELLALGEAVRKRRQAAGLSQEQLAERAGLHRNYVGGIERGERNVAYLNLRRLAVALGYTLSELVADADAE